MSTILDRRRPAFPGRLEQILVGPGAAGWAGATRALNLAVTQEPALVALPEDERDVIEIVRYAAAHGLQVAPQTPDVSVAGYSLGGGVGWYARKLGLSANSVLAIELVTADGELRRVDREHDPELFWALRGGGGSFAVVEAVSIGGEAESAELLAPLRTLGPALDTFSTVPPAGIAELHMDPPDPTPYTGEGFMLGELDGTAIDRFVAAAGPDSGSVLVSAEIRHLGGALHRSAPHHGALAILDASFISFELGMLTDEAARPLVRAQLDRVAAALAPYENGRQYLNFAEARTDPARFYPSDVYERLRAVKARVDPGELFRANHPIASAR